MLPALICVGPEAPPERVRALEAAGAEVALAPTPEAILAELHRRGCLGVLLEGGPRLAKAFWEAGLIDEVAAAIAPRLFGGGLPPFAGSGGPPQPLVNFRVRKLSEDLWVTGAIR